MQNRWFQFWGISKPTYNVHSYKTYHIQKLNHTTCATHTHQLIRIHTEHIHNTYMCRIYIYITIFIYPLSTPILSILSNIQIHTHACMLHVLPASMYNTTHAQCTHQQMVILTLSHHPTVDIHKREKRISRPCESSLVDVYIILPFSATHSCAFRLYVCMRTMYMRVAGCVRSQHPDVGVDVSFILPYARVHHHYT